MVEGDGCLCTETAGGGACDDDLTASAVYYYEDLVRQFGNLLALPSMRCLNSLTTSSPVVSRPSFVIASQRGVSRERRLPEDSRISRNWRIAEKSSLTDDSCACPQQ
jgi:hypothetical protein